MQILNTIVEKKKIEVKEIQKIKYDKLPQNTNNFIDSLQKIRPAVIAELKKKSPSEGLICDNFNPVERAKLYEKGGARAISVLTDNAFFGGSFDDLKNVSDAVSIPTLAKDFIIDQSQVHLARYSGASACLLIVRILTDQQLLELKNEIEALNMTALIEIFDHKDLERALKVNPQLIGINNRNLDSLKMDTNNASTIAKNLPKEILTLSLSGAKTAKDIKEMGLKFDGVLVGTALMKEKNPHLMLKAAIA